MGQAGLSGTLLPGVQSQPSGTELSDKTQRCGGSSPSTFGKGQAYVRSQGLCGPRASSHRHLWLLRSEREEGAAGALTLLVTYSPITLAEQDLRWEVTESLLCILQSDSQR